MSIRIIPQDQLEKSPRLKNLYNRRAARLRKLAENNPLGDYLRFAALIAHAQEVVLYDHPLEMDLTARKKRRRNRASLRSIFMYCRATATGRSCCSRSLPS
ncbi:formate dehydrogenase formation protein FdhE [Cronobacter dublinensis 582]|nr:formate dehydrogenase formation protein FdhE [Cronobacter dublinensis 582]